MAMPRMPRSRLGKSGAALAIAIATVGTFEGVRTVAYKDIVGVPTICFGETRGVNMGDRHTMAECKKMLGDALIEFSAGVDKCLTADVPDLTYVALVSFAYNVGLGAFCSSTLVRRANAGDLVGACNQLPRWNRAGGKVVRGLSRRRAEEKQMCLDGLRAGTAGGRG